MDKKLPETSNLGVKIINSQRQVKKSRGTNSPLPFDVNVMLNFANSRLSSWNCKITLTAKLFRTGSTTVI